MCLLQCSDRVEPPEVKVAMTSRGRRVKQSRPTRCVARDADAQFRGAICRFAMTFDGRRAQLNIAADFRPVDSLPAAPTSLTLLAHTRRTRQWRFHAGDGGGGTAPPHQKKKIVATPPSNLAISLMYCSQLIRRKISKFDAT